MNSSVILAGLSVLTIVLSGIGTRFHWFHFRTGLALFALSGLLGLAAVITGALVWRQGAMSGIAAAIVGALVLFPPTLGIISAAGKPMIHDITTDLEDPPRFETLPVAPYDPGIAPQQRAAYGDVTSLTIAAPPAEVFARARAAVESNEWEIAAARPEDGTIEATATTGWFGFKDDVIVRIRATAEGSRVDLRSTSRVGKSDVGMNAKRIRAFLAQL